MDFLYPNSPHFLKDYDEFFDDAKFLFKVKKITTISAQNFLTLLLIINGEREYQMEMPNDFKNSNWEKAGAYDRKGLFHIRIGEHKCIY